jgi:hypothetical protein
LSDGWPATDGSVISTVPPVPELTWKFDVTYCRPKLMSAASVPPLVTISVPLVFEALAEV